MLFVLFLKIEFSIVDQLQLFLLVKFVHNVTVLEELEELSVLFNHELYLSFVKLVHILNDSALSRSVDCSFLR